jgi:hypothetical protein
MTRILTLLLAVASVAVQPGWAQQDQPQKSGTARFGDSTSVARHLQDLFYGVVKSLDNNEMVLEKTKFGVDQTIKLNEKTKYVRDGKASKFDSLKVGEQVWLQIKTDKKTGEMTAMKVFTGVIAPTISK